MEPEIFANQRYALIHLLRSGKTPRQAARELGRPFSWVHKWKKRYEQEGWGGLEERSKAPRHVKKKTPEAMRREILASAVNWKPKPRRKMNLATLEAMPFMDAFVRKDVQPLPVSVRSSAFSAKPG